jgi:RNA polymerase sigma-70 factor (ECF subfamily)
MDDRDWLAEQFEASRPHLRSVAFRILGSSIEADDAVQESWLRLQRSDTSDVGNLTGWLTTVVGRVCLDMLRARKSRREEPIPSEAPVAPGSAVDGSDPEKQALLADSVGTALLVVLDSLSPSERLAFVLHDMFAVPFDEVAGVIGTSPAAARQLASRARRRVRGGQPTEPADPSRQREVVAAFLAASQNGDFDALLRLLDPDVTMHADLVAVGTGAPEDVRGALAVAQTFVGRARAARLALVDGVPGWVWSRQGRPAMVFTFTVETDRVVHIELIADPHRLDALETTSYSG